MLESRFYGDVGNWWVLYIDHDEKVFYSDELEVITEKFNLELTNEYIQDAQDIWLQDPSGYTDYLESNGYESKDI